MEKCDVASSNMETSVGVIYENADQAEQAVEQLNNYEYQGSVLKVEFMNNGRNSNNSAPRGGNGGGRPRNSGTGNPRGTGYPLRILVQSDFVGAIIGRKGQTIRNITTQTRARVDVHGKENSGLVEKDAFQVISIYGQPGNCTNACKEILKVMQQEAAATSKNDITLKMLADDRFCGRIIGKEGKVIKKIREDTDTRITVSNVQEVPAMYPDRVITIKGSIDNMSAAEAAISTKLRECYEKEMQLDAAPGMMMQPGLSGLPMMASGGFYGMRPPYNQQSQAFGGYPNMYASGGSSGGPSMQASGGGGGGGGSGGGAGPMPGGPICNEMCQVAVPNSAVGAIIGAGGSNIKQVIRDSNAFVTIEPKKDNDPDPAVERIVTIKGSQDAQWRASYFIFEKLKQEGFAGNDDVRLKVAMKVPRSMVGRVIGKGGKNVRDIQRMTGAMIKLPEDQANQGEETVVETFGNFMATQSAMSRIRALIMQTQSGPPTPVPPPPPQNRRGPPRNHQN